MFQKNNLHVGIEVVTGHDRHENPIDRNPPHRSDPSVPVVYIYQVHFSFGFRDQRNRV